jgi:CRP-like cAMP-binding protein
MYPALLANVAQYISLTPAEQAYFTSLLVPLQVTRFGYVLQAGEPTRSLLFVTRGCVRTYATDAHGHETVLGFAWEGWWAGDAASALAARPATLTIQALETTQVLLLSVERLEQLCAHVPACERFFRLVFQNALLLEQPALSLATVARRRALRPLLSPVPAPPPARGPEVHRLLFGYDPGIFECAAHPPRRAAIS